MSCANFYFLLVTNVIIMMIWCFHFFHQPHDIFPDTAVLSVCVIYSYPLTTLVNTTVV